MRVRWQTLLYAAPAVAVAQTVLARRRAPDRACNPLPDEKYWPPWNAPPADGVNFTVPTVENVPDLYGDIADPQLVVFFGGNQYMAVPELLEAFRAEHPEIERIYAEMLPPAVLAEQIEQGALVVGNLRIAVRPDVYTAGSKRIEKLRKENDWFDRTAEYAGNTLAIMVAKGNPLRIRSLEDLGRPDVRVAMPDARREGIATLIEEALKKAGGRRLVERVLKNKITSGATYLTRIHHRETPLRIMLGASDAGPVWLTEAKFQEAAGHPLETVEIPKKHNVRGVSKAAALRDAPHPEAARAFLEFLTGPSGQAIYRKHGFLPASA